MILIEPFQEFAFMRNALMATGLVGLTCATLGVYVVFRRMAFIGDAMAHTAFPVLVIAHLKGWNLLLGALFANLVTAFGIGWLSRRRDLEEDTAIGITFTSMFAIGILLASRSGSFRDLAHILFGNVLGVTWGDLLLIAGMTVIVLCGLVLYHKELELTSFDPQYAAVIGIRVAGVRFLLLILLALTVVTSIQVVGVILTSALLITPAATASLLTQHLRKLMAISVTCALFSGITGLYLSYYFELPAGAAIVVVCTGLFLMAYAWKGQKRFHRTA